jgi:tetratricopeptide (TPR) repeat protein
MAWRIHPLRPDLAFLMAGFEARPYLGKLDAIFRLERVGDARAMDVLRAVAGRDPSFRVRAYAARAADRVHFRLGGGRGDVLTVLNTRGCAHLAKGEWKKALACFDKMLELDPANQTALYNKACTYARWKKTDLAVAFLEKAVKAGFRDRAHIENDADLESIRKDPRYLKIVKGLPRGN